MDGSDGGGGPPIPALITNYVEGLWVLLVSAMGTCGESYHQHLSSGRGGGVRPQRRWGNRPKVLETIRSRCRKSVGGWPA